MFMNVRMKVTIVAGVAIIGLFYVGFLMQNNQEPEEYTENRTEISSSTSSTGNVEANETADRTNVLSDENAPESEWDVEDVTSDTSASYKKFDLEDFRQTEGTRILFFHDTKNDISKKMETFIKENLTNFSKDVTFFALDYKKEADLIEYYSIERPGVLIAFDQDGRIDGIYASEEPSLGAIKPALSI